MVLRLDRARFDESGRGDTALELRVPGRSRRSRVVGLNFGGQTYVVVSPAGRESRIRQTAGRFPGHTTAIGEGDR